MTDEQDRVEALMAQAYAAELEAVEAREESDADPDDMGLYHYADVAHAESYWAQQALPVYMRYPDRTEESK